MNANRRPSSPRSRPGRRFRLAVVGGACCWPRWPHPEPWSPTPTASMPTTTSGRTSPSWRAPRVWRCRPRCPADSSTSLWRPDEAAGADNVGHHLVIARLNDGVTLDDVLAADDSAFTELTSVKGGNGTIAAGQSLDMTLDLEPGDYFVLDNPQLPDPVIETFSVVAGARCSRASG